MHDVRFFQTTRGRIVTALRRRHAASAVDLAVEFGLSANAVRQQLVTLERDGYVHERAVRRGPTKPTLEYSLTEAAEGLFPQQYAKLLGAVLRGVRDAFGDGGLATVVETMADRAVHAYGPRIASDDVVERARSLASLLRMKGVDAEVVMTPEGAVELVEHNCPYARSVGEHPELCGIIRTVLHETVASDVLQLESIATGGESCRFEVASAGASGRSSQGDRPT